MDPMQVVRPHEAIATTAADIQPGTARHYEPGSVPVGVEDVTQRFGSIVERPSSCEYSCAKT